MSNKNKKPITKTEVRKSTTRVDFVFARNNYMLMIAGFLVIIIGFLLMYGGKEDIYSFRKITVAPIVVISGFIIEVFAIMVKPKDKQADEPN